MSEPKVSFIVPCYKLAHLLAECVHSILAQTHGDLEVLIMDDHSPDNTRAVALSFADRRVRYIHNDSNLGHLRNYNKGIELARGKYIWLISADDYLRRTGVLQRYVELMERQPRVGYCICPGVGISGGSETGVLDYSVRGGRDRIIPGHQLLKTLLLRNTIIAASGLVRRECYDTMSVFPLDMPWAGDWYLWCLFALRYDAGYFAEPMVCYRKHELSNTTQLWAEKAAACCEEDVGIPWAVKRKAEEAGLGDVVKSCLRAVVELYFQGLVALRYGMSTPSLTLDQFEASLARNAGSEAERNWVRARVLGELGNSYYWRGDHSRARQLYRDALQQDPWMTKILAKQLLLSSGGMGDLVRKWLRPTQPN
jgi:glycosyltransferase involved in cell wall biosynthesis